MSKQAHVKKEEIPAGWSLESADFTNRVIYYNKKSFCKENPRID